MLRHVLSKVAWIWSLAALSFALPGGLPARDPAPAGEALSLVVMDPLAAPLSCPCVAGYAQRKYEKLAEYLQQRLKRPVRVTFAESLGKALRGDAEGRADLIIGKDSVVRADAKSAKLRVAAVARLTGKDGSTTQTGLFVVPAGDPAQRVADLKGYRIFFGPPDCQEKHAAALEALRAAGATPPDKIETSAACSDGACRILELGADQRGAAVISSYAKPLLEGCGTVKKGSLRAIGETQPVPFITAFVSSRLPKRQQRRITNALLDVGSQPELCQALETLLGFVAPEEQAEPKPAESKPAQPKSAGGQPPDAGQEWTGWRGPHRDGLSPTLPRTLPAEAKFVWRQTLAGPGLGGIAATRNFVLFGDRDLDNRHDVFRCLDAATGLPLWQVQYPAEGKLDYGNTPRATPLVHGELVYLFGAFGDLHCVRLDSGEAVWRKNLRQQYGVSSKLVWGACSSPLLVDGRLIVNPGAKDASLVALDPQTGSELWRSPGGEAAFGSLIEATLGGVRQIVGHDRTTLGGWDRRTGRRLWTLTPPAGGDFNVPTPVVVGDRLLVTTENNGTRLYAFDPQGRIRPQPVAQSDDLAPDISTPVVVNGRVFCVWGDMYCLDPAKGLAEIWRGEDDDLADYAAVIGGNNRVLVIGAGGRLLLVDAAASQFRVISRLTVFADGDTELYSHPALVGDRLYLRSETTLACLDLSGSN